MRVAAIFHNRLLEYDEYLDFDWNECDPDGDEPLLPEQQHQLSRANSNTQGDLESNTSAVLTQAAVGSQEHPIRLHQGLYEHLKAALIKNLNYACDNCKKLHSGRT